MSENRLRKSCRKFYINPIEVEKRLAIRKAVILADSKGKYIEREVITEHCPKVKSIWKKGWKIQDCINWAKNNLTTIFDATEKYTFYIWLGTCDITHLDKKTRFISLESEDSTNVWYIIRKFNELKEIIVSKIAGADVVFLEVPSISIQHWNYSQGHTNYKDYEEQDKKLELHLDILNEEIRKVNGSGDRSPRFMQDLWRGSKGHNTRSHTKTYTDLSLLERDGVHPIKILARLWLRRIATKILTDCFSKIPANQLWQSKT